MEEEYTDVIDMMRKKAFLPVALKYADVPELAPIIQAIPGAGPIINGYLNALGTLYTKRSIEKIIRFSYHLDEEIKKVGVEKIDRNFFGSEDFHDLFFLVNAKLQRGIKNYKLRYLARLLKSASLKEGPLESDKAEEFMEVVDSLSRYEMHVLFIVQELLLKEPNRLNLGDETVYSFLVNEISEPAWLIEQFTKEDILTYLNRLRRFGFLLEITGVWRSEDDLNTTRFEMSNYLRGFLKHIRNLKIEDISR